MRIAVIQTAFPGDVILSLPVFEALKAQDKSCEITAIVRPESVCLVQNNPNIDRTISYDKYGADTGLSGISRIASLIRDHDEAIIVQRHLRAALVAYLARIPERIGYDISAARFLYTRKIKYRHDKHEVQRCLDLVGIDDLARQFSPTIYIDDGTVGGARNLLRENGITSDFAVVAPGSVWATKRYPEYSKVVDLIYDRLGIPVVLVGGADDVPLSRSICENAIRKPVDLTGRTDLLQSAAIISKAKIAVSNDSAPAHIAAAVGTPVVAIFGPTSPSFGFAPYAERSVVVDTGRLYCRPCTVHGSKRCPEKHFDCMRKVAAERVVDAARSLLGV